MTDLFQFEEEFAGSLHCIPMSVRLKLDTCGVKLKLTHWNHLTMEERQALITMPCSTTEETATYRDALHAAIARHGDDRPKDLAIDPHPPWADGDRVPDAVQAKAVEVGAEVASDRWQQLSPLQRFALIKLSQSGHENRNFLPALREFGIIS